MTEAKLKTELSKFGEQLTEESSKVRLLLTEMRALRNLLLSRATQTHDVKLERYVTNEVVEHLSVIEAMKNALRDLHETSDTGLDSPSDRKLHLEHLLALEKNALEQVEIHKRYLLGMIARFRAKADRSSPE